MKKKLHEFKKSSPFEKKIMNLKIGNENEKKRKEKLNIRKPAKQNLEKRRGAAFFLTSRLVNNKK